MEQIGEMPLVIEKLKSGKRAEVWFDKRLKEGAMLMVRELYTEGPGYEAKVVSIFDEGKTLDGRHLWRYGIEPTGRVEEIVAYKTTSAAGEQAKI